jgi:hypothetical protein
VSKVAVTGCFVTIPDFGFTLVVPVVVATTSRGSMGYHCQVIWLGGGKLCCSLPQYWTGTMEYWTGTMDSYYRNTQNQYIRKTHLYTILLLLVATTSIGAHSLLLLLLLAR